MPYGGYRVGPLLHNGPLTIGIDGGFVRDQRDKGWFEVIAGKSVLEFRRATFPTSPNRIRRVRHNPERRFHNRALFYRPGLFGDRIVLDQNLALEAIYAIFDRKKILPLLRV